MAILPTIVFAFALPNLWGQSVASPFAAYEQSLARRADTLLEADASESGCASSIESTARGLEPGTEANLITARLKSCLDAPSQPQKMREATRRWGRDIRGLQPVPTASNLPAPAGLGSASARTEFLRPAIEPILTSRGVPVSIASAVMLVESGGRADALSPKGARGLWQLMPETARRYGLRVDEAQDERLNLFKATQAAAAYLHDLYARFGDWKLALAAYNAGENSVSSAILRAGSGDFDRLSGLRMLPQETRDYVPRVLARVSAADFGTQPGPRNTGAGRGTTIFAVNRP